MAGWQGTDPAVWAQRAQDKLALAVRKIAIDAFTRIVIRSPVDTGRFRGNWQVSIENIPSGSSDTGKSEGEVIGEINSVVGQMRVGQSIFFVNNLPYARRLEYGWSKQAPNGMVRLTVQEFQPIVDAIVAQLSRER